MVSDRRFQRLVDAVGQRGNRHFTRNELYTIYCIIRAGSPTKQAFRFLIVGVIVGAVLATTAELSVPTVLLLACAIGVLFAVIGYVAPRYMASPSEVAFIKELQRWLRTNPTPNLLEKPCLRAPLPEWREIDIHDYDVERALLVDDDILVDLCVANGLHAQHRMLVLSLSGYPDYLVPVFDKLVAETPLLPVFMLHGSNRSIADCRRAVASTFPFLDPETLRDLGFNRNDQNKLERRMGGGRSAWPLGMPVDAVFNRYVAGSIGPGLVGVTTLTTVIESAPPSRSSGHERDLDDFG